MLHTHEASRKFLIKLNTGTPLHFDDTSCDYDVCDSACGEYDGIIFQVCFPNSVIGLTYFRVLKTDIRLAEATSQLKNQNGSFELTLEEVIILINEQVKILEEIFKRKFPLNN